MPNSFTYQVIKDTTESAVIKITGNFDGSGQEDNTARIQANTLYGALDANNVPLRTVLSQSNTAKPFYGLSVNRMWYNVTTGAQVQLLWTASTSLPVCNIIGSGEYDGSSNWPTIPNNAEGTAGCNGNIGVSTKGMAANGAYTIILDIRKHNEYYQRGQFNDPAAFNFGSYSIRPAP